jgi:hypothetical protein
MLDEWAEALLKREVVVYDKDALKEHLHFIRPEKTPTHPEAITGKNDDMVISHAGCWQVLQLVTSEDPDRRKKVTQVWDSDFGKIYR